ncbi:MAG: type II toxin-antitoxin system RelE/ParE family toxin [Gammaproteobacteria bacterium]|nr:type II toxin-antitoxin system RelE/ParE family toxin [Gammaproteobacteria bacterium]
MNFRHKALRTLYESDSPRGLPPELVSRIRRILADLDHAVQPNDLAVPGYRLHPLSGEWDGFWSVHVSANSRIVFRFENGEPTDVNLIDYH